METLVQLIFIIALVKYCLTAAQSGNLCQLAGYAVVAALVALALYTVVIEQPTTIITELLASRTAVSNIALLTTAEAIAGIFVSVYLVDNYFKPKTKQKKRATVLKIVPGALVFAAIAYFELLFFKIRVGGDFLTTAGLYSTILFVVICTLGGTAKYALTAESLRLEVKVILNMAILIGGLLVSSSVADYNISHAQTTIEWEALVALIAGSALLVALGLILHKMNRIKQQRQWNR